MGRRTIITLAIVSAISIPVITLQVTARAASVKVPVPTVAPTALPTALPSLAPTPVPTAPPAWSTDVVREADWILSTILDDGAIATNHDKTDVWPYLSNFAAMGLVRATEVTRDATYERAALRWLRWYAAHEDADGYVTDHKVVGGVAQATADMDSTDAYAGTFLMATLRWWQHTRDTAALKTLAPGIRGALKAIRSTTDADGLTWAKPSWRVKYLMDQCETHAGLVAGSKLLKTLGDKTGANKAAAAATKMRSAIDALWDPTTGTYDWAVHGDGARDTGDMSVFYPDALQQAWVVAFGLSTGERASTLMQRFATAHPYWDDPTAPPPAGLNDTVVNYWPVAGWAMQRAGSDPTASALSIAAATVATSHAWPYTSASAGQLIDLLSGGPALP